MPLFGLGVKDGLVLDVGDSEATLIPVYESVPILKVGFKFYELAIFKI
jgi:hypothetical protein